MILKQNRISALKRRITLSLFSFTYLLSLCVLHAQPTLSFSLEESIAYALEHNLRFNNEALQVERASVATNQVLADGFPQINGVVDYDYNLAIRRTIFPDFLSPAIYGVLEQEDLSW